MTGPCRHERQILGADHAVCLVCKQDTTPAVRRTGPLPIAATTVRPDGQLVFREVAA